MKKEKRKINKTFHSKSLINHLIITYLSNFHSKYKIYSDTSDIDFVYNS